MKAAIYTQFCTSNLHNELYIALAYAGTGILKLNRIIQDWGHLYVMAPYENSL